MEKKPWKDLPALRGPIELEFLRPLYLGESLAPFRLLAPAEAIIPWDATSGRLLDSGAALGFAYTYLPAWLKRGEDLWDRHGKEKMTLSERLDKFHALIAQMPAPRLRVIYSASGTIPAAAILRDRKAILEHKLYWAKIDNEREGRFLIGVLNSEVTRAKVAPLQSRGQWGARDFDKLLAEAVPQFDRNNSLHAELAQAAATAEKIAARVQLPDEIHFVRARKAIRDALRADGIAHRIDALAARLLGG